MQIGTADIRSFLKLYDKICEKQSMMTSSDFAVFMGKECGKYRLQHPKTSVMLVGMQLHIQERNKDAHV